MQPAEMLAVGFAVAAVGYLVLGPKGASKPGLPSAKRPGRAFLEAMDEVMRDAAALKIEKTFGESPHNPHLGPLKDLAGGGKAEAEAPKS